MPDTEATAGSTMQARTRQNEALRIVTCVSDASRRGPTLLLRTSCQSLALDLVVLHHRGRWISHRLKDYYLLLFARTIDPDCVVLFTNGHHTVLTEPAEQLLDRYEEFDAPLVFAASDRCQPCEELAPLFPSSGVPLPYVRAGAFVGKAGFIADLLGRYAVDEPSSASIIMPSQLQDDQETRAAGAERDSRFAWSNQYFWSLLFLRHRDQIALDHHRRLFGTISSPDLSGHAAIAHTGDLARATGIVAEIIDAARSSDGGDLPCHLSVLPASRGRKSAGAPRG